MKIRFPGLIILVLAVILSNCKKETVVNNNTIINILTDSCYNFITTNGGGVGYQYKYGMRIFSASYNPLNSNQIAYTIRYGDGDSISSYIYDKQSKQSTPLFSSGTLIVGSWSSTDWLTINMDGLYKIKSNGDSLTPLIINNTSINSPSWSPDGKKLAVSNTVNNIKGIYIMKNDGSNLRPLDSAVSGWGPAWSPDGSTIAYNFKDVQNNYIGLTDTALTYTEKLTPNLYESYVLCQFDTERSH